MVELFSHIMITLVIAIMATLITEFFNFLLKRRIIKSGQLNEHYVRLLTRQTGKSSALKWGILFLCGGIGLVIIGMLPFKADESPIPWGIEVVCIGAGFLVYYLLVKNDERP